MDRPPEEGDDARAANGHARGAGTPTDAVPRGGPLDPASAADPEARGHGIDEAGHAEAAGADGAAAPSHGAAASSEGGAEAATDPSPSGDDAPVDPTEDLSPDPAWDVPGAAAAASAMRRGRRGKRQRRVRPHPFAHEAASAEESRLSAGRVTALWLGGATAAMVAGLLLSRRYSEFSGGGPPFMERFVSFLALIFQVEASPSPLWEQWTLVPLFAGLVLLGFGFFRQTWSKQLTMAGWLLFGFYWGLTATDLYASEDEDIVNYLFALLGVYFFAYLAYQQWLDLLRGSDTHALHFLNVTAFIAAGTYFLIAKITFLRVWLIHVVSNHTKWMLDLFGQGDKANLQFIIDRQDPQGPVWFFYPQYYCETGRGDLVSEYCRNAGVGTTRTYFPEASGWWESILYYNAESQGVVPVQIILACTAIQSIMLFVGLFAATKAPLRKKVYASLVVSAVIYVLNLVRNTGIIWFYGQGHASFWLMHNAIGKGGSLLAMIGIAFAVFRWFPEFFDSLVQVLDLPDRDGPIERTLKIGRRRPLAAAAVDPAA